MTRSLRVIRTVVLLLALIGLAPLLAGQSGTPAAAADTLAPRSPAPGVAAGQSSDAPPVFGPAGGETDAEADEPRGLVVPLTGSITALGPVSDAIAVDAHRVDLRQVFEDLGPDATLWYQHVQTLANPFFEGRRPGTRGADMTADYIEFYFRHYGLEPAFGAEGSTQAGGADDLPMSYRQPFDFARRGRQRPPTVTESVASIGEAALLEGDEFVVLGNSGSGQASGPVTFVGYGIESGPDGYTSFESDTDLTGRIALLLRYEPLDEDGYSLWAPSRFSGHAAIATKMASVEKRGAAGIILVNPPEAKDGRIGLEPLRRSSRFGAALGIPAIQVTPEVADQLLLEGDFEVRDLMTVRRLADEGEVTTVDLDDNLVVSFGSTVARGDVGRVNAQNVGGILRGRGDLADEWIVISAHHDHVGDGTLGGINRRNRGRMHPGADDNASGTAGVLVMARKVSESYASAAEKDLRSVLFLTFDAEEMGLVGSRHFANDPSIPPEQITMVFNMDMVGRLRGDNLSVLGTATAEGLQEILRPHFERSDLTVSVTDGGSGRSDDASFHRIGVPALHFFTGMHPEYTTPQDQAYTVNPAGADQLLGLMLEIVEDLAARPEKLVYHDPGAGPGQDRGYAPVRLGIRPAMGEGPDSGVLVDTVSEGTSAADAGMQDGDIIVGWDDVAISDLADLFEHLQQHKPGDKVTITVLRDGARVPLAVTFKKGE